MRTQTTLVHAPEHLKALRYVSAAGFRPNSDDLFRIWGWVSHEFVWKSMGSLQRGAERPHARTRPHAHPNNARTLTLIPRKALRYEYATGFRPHSEDLRKWGRV